MYYNNSLRAELQEWKNRLTNSSYTQFGFQFKFLFDKIEQNKLLNSILNEACLKHSYNDLTLEVILRNSDIHSNKIAFETEIHQVAYCYQFLKYCIKKYQNYNLHKYVLFQGDSYEATRQFIIDDYITPILNYLHDSLYKSNSIIYLLEKYKRRTEWFTKNELLNIYNNASKSYEEIFEHDLRLFLFDHGIDYPFSTPKSSAGKRADIVGSIDTDDPIIIEVKIIDKNKKYGKNRIKDGFKQILKYTNDYNKDFGYLVIFNVDNSELNFNFSDPNKFFPPMKIINNKTLFFITINLSLDYNASSSGKDEIIEISDDYLL